MQIAQDISLRMYVKKRRRSGLRRGFLACIIGEIAKSRCVSYFSTVPYSTTDKYIRSKTHSNAHQTVFTKEIDKYQWLVLEQKSQCEVEIRQTDSHGIITARDNYELTRNIPKCVGVERLCEGANFQIPFNADEVNLIYQFGE